MIWLSHGSVITTCPMKITNSRLKPERQSNLLQATTDGFCAKRKRGNGQPQIAKRKRGSAQPQIMKRIRYWFLFLVLTAGTVAVDISAQIQYASGQDVAPAFEGWQQNPDGTYSFVFGYLNRNYEEQVDVPIGPNNNIEPGGDAGQPAHF